MNEADLALVEEIEDDLDGFIGDMCREEDPDTRKKYARVAANIAEDRYSAGSTAAQVATIICLRHGVQAARDFTADLEHHQR